MWYPIQDPGMDCASIMAKKIEFGEAQDWRNPNNPSGTIYTWRVLTKNPTTPYISITLE